MDSGNLSFRFMIIIFKYYFIDKERKDILNFIFLNKYYLSKISQIIKCYPKQKNDFKIHYYKIKSERDSRYEIKKFLSTKYLSSSKEEYYREYKLVCYPRQNENQICPYSFSRCVEIKNDSILLKVSSKEESKRREISVENKGTIILSNIKVSACYLTCISVQIKKPKLGFLQLRVENIVFLENSASHVYGINLLQKSIYGIENLKSNILKLLAFLNDHQLEKTFKKIIKNKNFKDKFLKSSKCVWSHMIKNDHFHVFIEN